MWQEVFQNFNLSAKEIHIWRANLDIDRALQNHYWTILSTDEKARANRFKFPYLKTYYVAARGILRQLLGCYLNQQPASILFDYGAQGKPFLCDFPSFNFNISHAKQQAIFAFVKGLAIGVDVEYIDPTIELEVLAPRFFSKNETTTLLALPKVQQPLGFFHAWTRKEAFIKAKGGGLSIPLDQFEVTLSPNMPAKLVRIDWNMTEVSNWEMHSFFSAEDMVGAVIVEGKSTSISYFDWDRKVIPSLF